MLNPIEPTPELCQRVAEELGRRYGWMHLNAAEIHELLLMPVYEAGPYGAAIRELARELSEPK